MAENETDQTRHPKNITDNRKEHITTHLPYKNLWVQPLYRNSEGSFPIYVNLSLWVQLWQYVLNSEKNQGGIFLGKLCLNQENPFCEILSFVEVSYKSQEMNRLTGKRWRWSPTGDVGQEQGETDQILGWFKTHNGHGPYLSRSDTILHKRFFNREGQMAVVFDKLSKESGFFLLENNQIVKNFNIFLYSSDRDLLEERLASLVNPRGNHQDEKSDENLSEPGGIASEDLISSTDSLLFIHLLNKSRKQYRQTEKLSEPAEEQAPCYENEPLVIEIAEISVEKDSFGQASSFHSEDAFQAQTPIEAEKDLEKGLIPEEAEPLLEGGQEGQTVTTYKHPTEPSEEKRMKPARTLQIDDDLAFDSALAVVSNELSQRIRHLNDLLDKKH